MESSLEFVREGYIVYDSSDFEGRILYCEVCGKEIKEDEKIYLYVSRKKAKYLMEDDVYFYDAYHPECWEKED